MAKLTVELVPSTCFYSNVRTLLPKKEWDRLRKESYKNAGYLCEICKGDGKKQGFRHSLECHEIWEYNDKTKVQKLGGLISLCPRCHMVKHFGRTTAIGKQDVAIKQIENVNKWSHKKTVTYLAEVFAIQKLRSKSKWSIDLNILQEKHQVDKKLILEAHRAR